MLWEGKNTKPMRPCDIAKCPEVNCDYGTVLYWINRYKDTKDVEWKPLRPHFRKFGKLDFMKLIMHERNNGHQIYRKLAMWSRTYCVNPMNNNKNIVSGLGKF